MFKQRFASEGLWFNNCCHNIPYLGVAFAWQTGMIRCPASLICLGSVDGKAGCAVQP